MSYKTEIQDTDLHHKEMDPKQCYFSTFFSSDESQGARNLAQENTAACLVRY